MALTPLEVSHAAGSPIRDVGQFDSAHESVRGAAPRRDLHLMHLAIIVQRQEIARHGLAIDRHVEWRAPRRSVVAHANG